MHVAAAPLGGEQSGATQDREVTGGTSGAVRSQANASSLVVCELRVSVRTSQSRTGCARPSLPSCRHHLRRKYTAIRFAKPCRPDSGETAVASAVDPCRSSRVSAAEEHPGASALCDAFVSHRSDQLVIQWPDR